MNRYLLSSAWLAIAAAALGFGRDARADNFGRVRYDAQSDQLVVTMIYRGTNSNHAFTLKWGQCQANQSAGLPGATAEVLDDQFNDPAQHEYKKTVRFSLTALPCARPAAISLRTAPRFVYTLTIPGA